MVGLDRFKEAFAEFSDNYVIIGGTACDIVMTGTAVRPRATHDIDMIVVVENMTPEFGQRFWDSGCNVPNLKTAMRMEHLSLNWRIT